MHGYMNVSHKILQVFRRLSKTPTGPAEQRLPTSIYLKTEKLLVFKKVKMFYEFFWNTILLIKISGWGGGRDSPYPNKSNLRATLPTLQWISGLFPGGKASGTRL